jgi:hypothetical protein
MLMFMSEPRPRDPREDKILSYQRDRRNCYGESPHGSRKSIRFRKAWVNRAYRRQIQQQLDPSKEPEQIEEQAALVRCRQWEKRPDSPLGLVVRWRRSLRADAQGEEVPTPSAAQLQARRRGRDVPPGPWPQRGLNR